MVNRKLYMTIFMALPISTLLTAMEPTVIAATTPSHGLRQNVASRWQKTKDLLTKYKKEITLMAVVMGASYMGERGYHRIATVFKKYELDTESLRERKKYKNANEVSHELLKLAIGAYITPSFFFTDYWNSKVIQSEIYDDLTTKDRRAFEQAMREIGRYKS